MQKYTSARTSINSKKAPVIFKKLDFYWDLHPGTKNLDYGGGKFDTATEFLEKKLISNFIYDPYNRATEWNTKVLSQAPFDSATLSNVLNVVESTTQLEILKHIYELLKPNSLLFITVYEGNKSGVTTYSEKRDSLQMNKKLVDYYDIVKQVFPCADIQNGVLIALKL